MIPGVPLPGSPGPLAVVVERHRPLHPGTILAVLLTGCLLAAPRGWAAGTGELRVAFPGQEAELTVSAPALASPTCEEPFLRSRDVAAVFRLHRGWDALQQRLVLAAGGHQVVITAGARLIRVDGTPTLLHLAPRYLDGELWLPLELVTRILPPLSRQQVNWDPGKRRLTLRPWVPDVTALAVETGPRRAVVSLAARRPLRWRITAPAGGTLRVTAAGATVDTTAVRLERPRGLVRRVRSRQEKGWAVVEVALSPLVGRYETRREDDGRRLLVILREEEGGALPLPSPRGSHGTTLASLPVTRVLRRVILDPGHGGADPGAVSGGLVEKDLVLDLARELRDGLRREGFQVELTRDADATVSARDRAETADRLAGDVLISLHADLWPDPRRKGAVLRILSRQPAMAAAAGPFVPWEAVQQRHLSRSTVLADSLAAALTRAAWPCRGITHDDLPLLRGVDMPAVILETGLLSNPADHRRLASPRRRRRLVDAVVGTLVALRRQWQPAPGPDDTGGRR